MSELSVLDDVRAEFNVQTNRCQTCVWLEQQPADEQVQWDAVMADSTIPHAAIFRAAKKRGFPRNSGSIEGHRSNMHQKEPAV